MCFWECVPVPTRLLAFRLTWRALFRCPTYVTCFVSTTLCLLPLTDFLSNCPARLTMCPCECSFGRLHFLFVGLVNFPFPSFPPFSPPPASLKLLSSSSSFDSLIALPSFSYLRRVERTWSLFSRTKCQSRYFRWSKSRRTVFLCNSLSLRIGIPPNFRLGGKSLLAVYSRGRSRNTCRRALPRCLRLSGCWLLYSLAFLAVSPRTKFQSRTFLWAKSRRTVFLRKPRNPPLCLRIRPNFRRGGKELRIVFARGYSRDACRRAFPMCPRLRRVALPLMWWASPGNGRLSCFLINSWIVVFVRSRSPIMCCRTFAAITAVTRSVILASRNFSSFLDLCKKASSRGDGVVSLSLLTFGTGRRTLVLNEVSLTLMTPSPLTTVAMSSVSSKIACPGNLWTSQKSQYNPKLVFN